MSNLHKSSQNKLIFGVCSGLSETLGIDPVILRMGFLFGAILTGSLLFWIYLALAFILPAKD